MHDKGKASLILMMLGLVGLSGCQSPHGGQYNNAVSDAPNYDATIYAPKNSPDFFDASHYHQNFDGFR